MKMCVVEDHESMSTILERPLHSLLTIDSPNVTCTILQ
jgi:hypothetical protein